MRGLAAPRPQRLRTMPVAVGVKKARQKKVKTKNKTPGSTQPEPGLRPASPAAELAARRCTTRSSAARTFVLVAEDQPAFFKIVGRHLDRHPIACQRLDPVLLHLARGVGHDLVSGIELHAVACVGEDFGHQSFELDQLFFSHGCLQIDRRSAWSLGTVGSGIRAAFAMQKGNPLHPFGPVSYTHLTLPTIYSV